MKEERLNFNFAKNNLTMEQENIITKNLITSYLIQDKVTNLITQFDENSLNENSKNIEKIFTALPENLQNDLKIIFSSLSNELKDIKQYLIKNDNELSSHFQINITKKEKDMYIKLIKLKLI